MKRTTSFGDARASGGTDTDPILAASVFPSRCAERLLRADRAAGGPVGITHPLEIHLKESHGLLAGHNLVADLPPRAIFDDCHVSDLRRARRDFPLVTVIVELELEVADATLCMGMQMYAPVNWSKEIVANALNVTVPSAS